MSHSLKLIEKIQYYYLDGRVSGCGAHFPSKSASKPHPHVEQSSLKRDKTQPEASRTTAGQPQP